MNIQTVNFNDTSFVSVTNPSNLEIKYLKNNFGFDTLHLDDYIYKTQVPKIEIFKDYALLVLDFPYFPQVGIVKNGDKKATITSKLPSPTQALGALPIPGLIISEKKKRVFSSQVDFFIGSNYLVILHDGSLSPINYIFMECQKTLRNREEYIGEGPVFLAYRIIDALVDACFPLMNELSSTIDKIDRELENKQSQNTLEEISTTRRNLVVFHTTVKPIIPLFKSLEEGNYKQLNGKMQPFWGNVVDHVQKIMDRIEDSRELIEGISESNESLLTSKTNEIIKVLTIFSAIILPLNLLASVYGMNIQLPFAHEPNSFLILNILMIIASFTMIVVFKLKQWF